MAGFIGFLIVMVIIVAVGKLIDVVGFTYEVMMTDALPGNDVSLKESEVDQNERENV